jgi:5-methylcytosine-specific restriction endonuclease McrA
VAVTYAKVPKRRPKLTNKAIAERDGYTCQVTGEYCPKSGSVDHLVPKSRGGAKKSWKNMAWMRADLNHKKNDQTLEEAGLKLLREPKEPPTLPANLMIRRRADKPDWDTFLVH